MSLAPLISPWLLQAGSVRDTIVTMPVHSWYDYTSGTLQLIVLALAVVVLGVTAYMMLALKRGLESLKTTVEKLYEDSRPIVTQFSLVAGDAREVVAMLRTDVERVTHAAGAVSEQLLDVAAAMENRLDEVSAVIDVVQDELEETALTATAALRGARLGGRALAGGLGKALMGAINRNPRRKSRDDRDDNDDRPAVRRRDRDRDVDRPRSNRNKQRDREPRYRENG
ncbi:MAG: DUF948 domain-containing protein [Gemmatimonas sp.]